MKKLVALVLALVLCAALAVAPAMADSLKHFAIDVPSSWTYMATQDIEFSGTSAPADAYLVGSNVVIVMDVDMVGALNLGNSYRDDSYISFIIETGTSSFDNVSAIQTSSTGISYVTLFQNGYHMVLAAKDGWTLMMLVTTSDTTILTPVAPSIRLK